MQIRLKAALITTGVLFLAVAPAWTKPSVARLAHDCNSLGKQSACLELAKIAVGDKDAWVRRSAVENITDQITLATVALNDPESDVRSLAVQKLNDQPTLAKIAMQDDEVTVRYAAAGRIQDNELLVRIAGSEQNKQTQMHIIVALRNLLAESGVLQGAVWISLRVEEQRRLYAEGMKTVSVESDPVDLSIMSGEKTVLAHKTWGGSFPDKLPRGTTSTSPDVNTTDLILDLCTSAHYSPSQIHQVLINIVSKDRGNWYGAMRKLRGEPKMDYSTEATALHWAASLGDKDLVTLMLANEADVNARDDDGSTPLHKTMENFHFGVTPSSREEVAELLLAHGADVNAKTLSGWTPLHSAASRQERDMAELLLAHGADVNAKANNGDTPLRLARMVYAAATVEMLLQHGAQ